MRRTGCAVVPSLARIRSCRAVVQDFITKLAEALEDLQALSGGLQRSSGLMVGSRS